MIKNELLEKNKKLADLIKAECSKKNTNVNQMLADCNLDSSVVDNIRKGSSPNIHFMNIIARKLEVSLDYLCERTSIDCFEIEKAYEEMDAELRPNALEYCKGLAQGRVAPQPMKVAARGGTDNKDDIE